MSGLRGGRRGGRCRAIAAPAASTPTSRTSVSSRKPWKIPIAFEPPPTHATTASGSRCSTASSCSRASRPITDCSSAHELRVRRRPDARADQVVGRLDVRDPVADRLARRLLQRLRAEVDAAHLRAEQPHPLDVGALAAHVLLAHVDDAVEAEARADGRGRDAVLAGAGLGDDPPLAEPPREHRLAERVVQLVRAGVEEILPLEVDPLPGGETLGEGERRRAARVRRQQAVELGAERVVGESLAPAALQLVERRDQRLGDVAAAVVAERAHARAAST